MSVTGGTQSHARPLDVLYSFGPPAEDANPYVHLLLESVAGGAKPHYFNWKYALLGKYDAFHVHWPETLLRRPTLKGRVACRVFLLALLAKLAATRTPIIRTEHNLRPHEAGNRIESAILNLLDRQTAAWVVMNNASEQPAHKLRHIPHGHYADWYKLPAGVEKKQGSVLNFGLIRPYKGVEDLIEAFRALPVSSGLSLTIMGKPQNAEAAQTVREFVGDDSRVVTDLRHIPDENLTRAIAEASLVALPYRAMHNSGALLLALSLGTPVFVPKNAMTDALAEEVGPEWVQRFEGPVTPEALSAAVAATEGIQGSPDLSKRGWDAIGEEHLRVYRTAA